MFLDIAHILIPMCCAVHEKIVNLFAPYWSGGNIGLFGGDGVSETMAIVELINYVAKAHGCILVMEFWVGDK